MCYFKKGNYYTEVKGEMTKNVVNILVVEHTI